MPRLNIHNMHQLETIDGALPPDGGILGIGWACAAPVEERRATGPADDVNVGKSTYNLDSLL